MIIKSMCWNIKEFGKKSDTKTDAKIRARVKKVADYVKLKDPDIFGLLEVENVDILQLIEDDFPDYNFSITDGERSNKEILVGRKSHKFDQESFFQKRQFNVYNPYLRPGALLSVRVGEYWYSFLFLHTDCGIEARDFGNRFEMMDKVWSLRKSLDKQVNPRRERLIVAGDLNTMGLKYPSKRNADERVSGDEEITAISNFASSKKMQFMVKSHDETWRDKTGYKKSDLDHVLTSDTVNLNTLGVNASGDDYTVNVVGWNDLTKAKSNKFYSELSDHSALYWEVITD